MLLFAKENEELFRKVDERIFNDLKQKVKNDELCNYAIELLQKDEITFVECLTRSMNEYVDKFWLKYKELKQNEAKISNELKNKMLVQLVYLAREIIFYTDELEFRTRDSFTFHYVKEEDKWYEIYKKWSSYEIVTFNNKITIKIK